VNNDSVLQIRRTNILKKILLIIVAVLMLGSIILAGCTPAPAPAPEPTPPGEPEWTPPIPGMKKGEEDLRFTWKFSFPAPRDKPVAGYELNKREWFFEEMRKRTGGRLVTSIVWGGQELVYLKQDWFPWKYILIFSHILS
jgi:hypothetical protein